MNNSDNSHTSSRLVSFPQGELTLVGGPLNLAIDGEGFFQVRERHGDIGFTRSGAFGVDTEDFITNTHSQRLMGFLLSSDGRLSGDIGPLKISTDNLPPKATENLYAQFNLPVQAAVPTRLFDANFTEDSPPHEDSFNFFTHQILIDHLGEEHIITYYFVKAEMESAWDMYIGLDGASLQSFHGEAASDTEVVATPTTAAAAFRLYFNSRGYFIPHTNHSANSLQSDNLSFPVVYRDISGTVSTTVKIHLNGSTQFAAPFSTSSFHQDGCLVGNFMALDVTPSGAIFGRYSNLQTRLYGQVGLAIFPAGEHLTRGRDDIWYSNSRTGEPKLDKPCKSGRGVLLSGFLENLNKLGVAMGETTTKHEVQPPAMTPHFTATDETPSSVPVTEEEKRLERISL